jgi:hypothetical protein
MRDDWRRRLATWPDRRHPRVIVTGVIVIMVALSGAGAKYALTRDAHPVQQPAVTATSTGPGGGGGGGGGGAPPPPPPPPPRRAGDRDPPGPAAVLPGHGDPAACIQLSGSCLDFLACHHARDHSGYHRPGDHSGNHARDHSGGHARDHAAGVPVARRAAAGVPVALILAAHRR